MPPMGCGRSAPADRHDVSDDSSPAVPVAPSQASSLRRSQRWQPSLPKCDETEATQSLEIDRKLLLDQREEDGKVKLLLLGTAESGKSTVLKQMRILYGEPFDETERMLFASAVRSNIIAAMVKLCNLLCKMGLEGRLKSECSYMQRNSSCKRAESSEGDRSLGPAEKLINESGKTQQHNGLRKGTESPAGDCTLCQEGTFNSESKTMWQQNGSSNEEKITLGDSTGMTPFKAYELLMMELVDKLHSSIAIPLDGTQSDQWDGSGSSSPQSQLNRRRSVTDFYGEITPFLKHAAPIRTLWQSETMREVWSNRAKANVIDSHKEFLDDLDRIASPSYVPTPSDILLARVKTKYVVTEKYRIDGTDYEITDVGGQRSDRGKWIHYFDDRDAVIFVVALSEYDQKLSESKVTNRMEEALKLFESICSEPAFANTSMLLFLNKRDLFAEKIQYSHIVDQTPFYDFAGRPESYDDGINFFTNKFKRINGDCYIHVTCAVDTNNMDFVLSATRRIIMENNLLQSSLLS